MKQLSKYMNKEKLMLFASGIFYSKLSYCLSVFGNVFGLEHYREENTRYTSYTKEDNNRLQILQNKLNRLLLGADYKTSPGHRITIYSVNDSPSNRCPGFQDSERQETHILANKFKGKIQAGLLHLDTNWAHQRKVSSIEQPLF